MLTGWKAGRMRITLAAIVTVVALGTLAGVWSYSTAIVRNEASLTITEPENALIALDLHDIIEVQQGETVTCGIIKNNLPVPLDNLFVSGDGYSVEEQSLGLNDSTFINLHIPPDQETGLYNYSGLVMADWDNGNAEIEFDMTVRVTAPLKITEPSKSDQDTAYETLKQEISIPLEPESEIKDSDASKMNTSNDNTGDKADNAAQQESKTATEN